jgi:hypothetical protein
MRSSSLGSLLVATLLITGTQSGIAQDACPEGRSPILVSNTERQDTDDVHPKQCFAWDRECGG